MTNDKMRAFFPKVWRLTVLLFAGLLVSCNTDFPNLLKPEYPNDLDGKVYKKSQVLLVIVDGLKGDVLMDMSAGSIPSLTQMSRNSIYSYGSLADAEDTPLGNAEGWATLLTGVTSSKHGIKGSNFAGAKLEEYPTIFSRLKSAMPEARTTAFGTSEDFISNLAEEATEKRSLPSDQETALAVAEDLTAEDSDIVVAQFSGVEQAGSAGGYDSENGAYRDAISKIDAHLGTLKRAIEARPDYARENWLIVVTSGKGGENEANPVAYNDPSRNTFTFLYSPKFASRFVPKPDSDNIPYVGFSPRYTGSSGDNNRAVLDDAEGLYNFGTNDFTIQFNIKGSGENRTWPTFLSRGPGQHDSAPGWLFYISNQNWSMMVSGGGSYQNFGSNAIANDGEWHTITVKFYKEGTSRKLKMFTDGVENGIVDITSRGSLNSSQPIIIGRKAAGDPANPDLQITNLQIYNTALSDEVVASTACNTLITEAHPNFENLVGYWPSDEGQGNVLKNKAKAGEGSDFRLQGAYQWNSFVDVADNLCPPVNNAFYQVVPNSVDLTFQMYMWLGISVPQSWKLDGKAWTPSYTSIRP